MKWKLALILVLAGLFLLSGVGLGYADTAKYYVKVGGTGDGASWANAMGDLREFLKKLPSEGNDIEIWVAKGGYGLTENEQTFHLKKGVKLYGGFAGTEKALTERDWKANVTTLNGNKKELSVVTGGKGAVPADTCIDGFTITGGVAINYSNGHLTGGGMVNDQSSPTIANCTFSENEALNGGGMGNISSSPTITNCTFSDNKAYDGGGMYNTDDSSPTITDCTFLKNMASSGDTRGGGMLNEKKSSPTITNCTFSENQASIGGGMCNWESSPTITNCIFSENWVASGGGAGMANGASSPTVTNCVFSKNSTRSNGGGMQNDKSSPTVTNCTFSENEAELGGGMYNKRNSSPVVTNCTFSENSGGEIIND